MASSDLWRPVVALSIWALLFFLEQRGSAGRVWLPAWRFCANVVMGGLNIVLIRLIMPLGLVAAATMIGDSGIGLIPLFGLSDPLAIILGFVLFDLAIYFQHRAFHLFPALWAFHRVHHADDVLDTSTAFRFHPGEALISNLFKLCVIGLLGLDPLSVLAAEIALNAGALFSHARIHVPAKMDGVLRFFVVTPAMHLTHHGINQSDQMRNFGFLISGWDRLFGTYTDRAPVRLGLEDIDGIRAFSWRYLLLSPFWGK